jgi:hypothetical protein
MKKKMFTLFVVLMILAFSTTFRTQLGDLLVYH